MPRVARALADEQIDHSINRRNRRDNIFHDEYDFTKMLNKVACPLYSDMTDYVIAPDSLLTGDDQIENVRFHGGGPPASASCLTSPYDSTSTLERNLNRVLDTDKTNYIKIPGN